MSPSGGPAQQPGQLSYQAAASQKTAPALNPIDMTNGYNRVYRLKQMPPNGLYVFIKEQFKSVDIFTIGKIELNGKFQATLSLHFGTLSDYQKAKSFSITIGKFTTLFNALDIGDTDGSLMIKPRIIMNMFLSDVPYTYAMDKSFLNKNFSKYGTLDLDNATLLRRSDGTYMGEVVIPVTEFKLIPKKQISLSFENNITGLVSVFSIGTKCSGFPPGTQAEEPPVPFCKYCKSNDHFINRCTKRARATRNFRCSTCNSSENNCTRSECKNVASMRAGNFPLPQRWKSKNAPKPRSGVSANLPLTSQTQKEPSNSSIQSVDIRSSTTQYGSRENDAIRQETPVRTANKFSSLVDTIAKHLQSPIPSRTNIAQSICNTGSMPTGGKTKKISTGSRSSPYSTPKQSLKEKSIIMENAASISESISKNAPAPPTIDLTSEQRAGIEYSQSDICSVLGSNSVATENVSSRTRLKTTSESPNDSYYDATTTMNHDP